MQYKMDSDTKKIVRAVIHADKKRQTRKRTGTMTVFDITAEKAIQAAVEEMDLQGYADNVKKHVIAKIYESLKDNTPWELLGETYCCRSLFYMYRKQFCYRVAVHMGIIDREE